MKHVNPDDIRMLFSRAMSDMYGAEVPQYDVLLELIADVNDETLRRDPDLKASLERAGELDRLNLERHGAIRLGTAQELVAIRRVFAVMGMYPVGYYDLSVAGIPVHSTAFRPINDEALRRSPFRVFTSLLRLELIEDEGLRAEAAAGVVVDVAAGHIYWTNMGNPSANDGSIERADIDGRNLTTIVPEGGTFTPKQLQLDKKNGKLYWSDREGMRVMRSNLDGSIIETLVETGHGEADRRDAKNWCVGIALDVPGGKLYWTQKGNDNAGQGRIFRANLGIPKGQTPANRKDIELLFDGLPEPIDLDLDAFNRMMYWTDRGDPPRGNTVNRAPMDAAPQNRKEPEIVFTHLMEGIGLALDLKGGRMFLTDFAGSVYSASLDGSNKKTLLFAQGNLTGIAYAELPLSL